MEHKGIAMNPHLKPNERYVPIVIETETETDEANEQREFEAMNEYVWQHVIGWSPECQTAMESYLRLHGR